VIFGHCHPPIYSKSCYANFANGNTREKIFGICIMIGETSSVEQCYLYVKILWKKNTPTCTLNRYSLIRMKSHSKRLKIEPIFEKRVKIFLSWQKRGNFHSFEVRFYLFGIRFIPKEWNVHSFFLESDFVP